MAASTALAAGDQRHRAVLNGIWDVGLGFQVSGVYFFGSGVRRSTTYGGDLRNVGGTAVSEQRLRPDGTIVPRNGFVGDPIHRVDMRLQKRFSLGGARSIAGLRRSVQPLQPRELRLVHDAGEQRQLRPAVLQQQPRVPGTDAPARLPRSGF